MIKDSGDRTEYSTGAVRDMKIGKGRCDLIPIEEMRLMLFDDRSLFYIQRFKETGDPNFLCQAILQFSTERYTNEIIEIGADGICPVTYIKEERYPPYMFLELAKHFEEGSLKYGENNWQRGIPIHSYIDSAIRHYLKVLAGYSDEPHDRAFIWNLICAIWTKTHHPELDDYTDACPGKD